MAHRRILTEFIVLIIVIHFSVTYALRNKNEVGFRQYNDPCILYDTSAQCNSTMGLMCLDTGLKGYRCLCPLNKLHAQIFDPRRGSCVGKVFNACVPGNSQSRMNETLCVENAECNTSIYGLPICLCKAGFTERDDGACIRSLKYGDSCGDSGNGNDSESTSNKREESQQKCDEKHGQACIDGKCQCKYPSEQYYDEVEGKCKTFAGGRCASDGIIYSCVPNANCPAPPVRISGNNNNPLLPPPYLGGGSVDEDEIFVMPLRQRLPHLPPHRPHPPPPFHPHQSHHHPLPFLPKQDPLVEFDTRFDNFDFGRSLIFGGSQASSNGGGGGGEFKDIRNSADEFDQPRCQCLSGFSRTAAGLCMKSYGAKCSPDDESSGGNSTTGTRELCNPDEFLECLDAHDGSFMCQCRNPLNERYDRERRMCVAIVGRRCRPLGNYPKCDKGADCISGMCQCTNGTSLTPLETCALDYNETCEPGECNVHRGLLCHGKAKTCMCIDSYLRYDSKKGACVASVNSPCGSLGFTTSSGGLASKSAYIDCEEGLECKSKEIAGQTMVSMCKQK